MNKLLSLFIGMLLWVLSSCQTPQDEGSGIQLDNGKEASSDVISQEETKTQSVDSQPKNLPIKPLGRDNPSLSIGNENMSLENSEWLNMPDNEYLSQLPEDMQGDILTEKKKIDVKSISRKEFLSYKVNYIHKMGPVTSKVERTDTSFTIQTDSFRIPFKSNKSSYSHFDYYLGYVEPLHLHAISSIDGHNEIGWLLLVDGNTGKTYEFQSPFDGPMDTPFVSPKRSYLLAYSNNLYKDDCFISILEIETKNSTYIFKDFYGLRMANAAIGELAWIDETSFAMCISDLASQETSARKCLKLSFDPARIKQKVTN